MDPAFTKDEHGIHKKGTQHSGQNQCTIKQINIQPLNTPMPITSHEEREMPQVERFASRGPASGDRQARHSSAVEFLIAREVS
jgi:hypothetical protein